MQNVLETPVTDKLKSNVAVVSANFGGIDAMLPFKTDGSYDGFYYTDEDTVRVSKKDAATSWTNVYYPKYPRLDFSPRLRAKYFKLQIHKLEEVKSYNYLCWMDGRILFRDTSFLAQAITTLNALPENKRVMMFANPFRKTVLEEYDYILKMLSEGDPRITAAYGHENNEVLNDCWNTWWDHNLLYTIKDQLSLTVIMNRYGIECQQIPGSIYDGKFIALGKHKVVM